MSGDTRQVTLRPSKAGHRQLDALLRQHCTLYNAALEHRFTAWKSHKASVNFTQQSRELTLVWQDDAAWAGQDRRLAIETLRRADKAYRNWFRRMKAAQKGGRPRFKSASRFRTLEIYSGANQYLRVNDAGTKGVIEIKGVPPLHFNMPLRKGVPRRPLPPGQPLTIRITRTPCRVTASLIYDIATPETVVVEPTNPLGIDLGVAKTLVSQHGQVNVEPPPRSLPEIRKRKRRLSRRMARQRQSALLDGRAYWQPRGGGKSRMAWKEGVPSRRYGQTRAAYAKLCERERLAQRNWQHRVTSQLVKDYDFIAAEDLRIQNMTASAAGTVEEPGRNVAQKRGLIRSILEQSWGGILAQLEYKAERAGIPFVRVPPHYTSKACYKCGSIDHRNRPTQPDFKCVNCGHEDNADVNAARNILRRGLLASGLAELSPTGGTAGCDKTHLTGEGPPTIPRLQGPFQMELPGFT